MSLQVPRFAPYAPGSTIFQPSTVKDNPGPGSYSADIEQLPTKSSPRGDSKLLKYAKNQPRPTTHPFSHLLKPNVPTIPRKEQCYGYTREEDGHLRRHDAPPTIYTGIGTDTVGPACYNLRKDPIETVTGNFTGLKSKTKRDVWKQLSPQISLPVHK